MAVSIKRGDTVQAQINQRLRLCKVLNVEPTGLKVELLDVEWGCQRLIQPSQVCVVINHAK